MPPMRAGAGGHGSGRHDASVNGVFVERLVSKQIVGVLDILRRLAAIQCRTSFAAQLSDVALPS